MARITIPRPLRYSLADAGMGVLERAGLAGLYLSLRGLDKWVEEKDVATGEQARSLRCLLQAYDLTQATELTLDWKGDDPVKPLMELVKWAWQVRDGVFFLPGVHRSLPERNNAYLRVPIA